MSPLLTTDAVPDQDKLDYWRTVVSSALVPMSVTPQDDRRFAGRIASDRLGYVRLSAVEADAQRTTRTRAHIARSGEALVAIGIQMRGKAHFTQAGQRATVGERQMIVYDTARPYSVEYPERFAARILHIPRRNLGLPDDRIDRLSGTVIDTAEGTGALLVPFLATLVTSTHMYSAAVAGRLAGHVVDLFATLVAEHGPAGGPRADGEHNALAARVRAYIDLHLGDPGLSPRTVAAEHHISVRYLHRVFEAEGVTVSRLVRQRRLEKSARELAGAKGAVPVVSAVAKRWGFVSPPHFSRVFRETFGYSPLEWWELHAS
ncbi:helix-turn-helix domain-containing protein [Streptomyces achromogenes]|uniref:Helix-turn-helix domain-containing protein n=1 Tax=Streptomyces achromogenes TaxID=67255 RepID=A0ABZ1KWG9_STRAH